MSKTTNAFSSGLRERAVLDNEGPHESHWQAMVSIATKIGCSGDTPKTQVDSGTRAASQALRSRR